jgi:hypothetical protein
MLAQSAGRGTDDRTPIKPKNAPVAAASDGRTFVLADGRTV